MKCQHKYTRNVLSGNSTHYAKAVCTDCGKFVCWKPKGAPISELLNVPFKDKEEAKLLGAKWDKFMESWYSPSQHKLKSLEKWCTIIPPMTMINIIDTLHD